MQVNRLKELYCVIFGHDWNESGSTTDPETKIVLEKYKRCQNCTLEIHDRSGYIEKYNLKYKTNNPL
jgi:hypothetical protein